MLRDEKGRPERENPIRNTVMSMTQEQIEVMDNELCVLAENIDKLNSRLVVVLDRDSIPPEKMSDVKKVDRALPEVNERLRSFINRLKSSNDMIEDILSGLTL